MQSPAMSAPRKMLVAAALAVACLALPLPSFAQGTITQISSSVTGTGTNLSGGGAWSWFSDNRAFYDNGNIVTGWVTVNGRLQAASYNLATSTTTLSSLYNGNFIDADDHNYPAFVKTSDGKYSAFYARHSQNGTFPQYQVSTSPLNATSWGSVQSIPTNTSGTLGTTYANPYVAPWDLSGNTVYNFWRGGNFNPTYSSATYNPGTGTYSAWSTAQNLISNPSQRPYMKYTSTSDRIAFAFTDAHPDNSDINNVYFAWLAKDPNTNQVSYYTTGSNSPIKTLAAGSITTSQISKLYTDTSTNSRAGNAWIWDTTFTADGKPVVAYSVANGGTHPHQSLYWAIYDGTQWITRTLAADAGGPIHHNTNLNEQYYTGGIALDPLDPFTVYISTKTTPSSTASLYQLSQVKIDSTDILGDFLSTTLITSSNKDNIRPYVPEDRPADTEMVLWMEGTYYNYVNKDSPFYNAGLTNGTGVGYNTVINLWTNPVEVASVPEPATLAIFSLASVALLLRRKR